MSAVNREIQFSLKPSTVRCKRYTKNIYSLAQNTNYSPSDTIIFNIPVGLANTVMDGKTAYLKFTWNVSFEANGGNLNVGAQAVALDYSANCFFNQLTTYGNSGQMLEQIARYNVLANTLYDQTYSQSQLKGLSALVGTRDGDTTDATNRYGVSISNATTTDGNTTTKSFTFCVPIFSGLFQLSEKYIPLYAMSGDSIRLELLLDTQVNALRIPTVANSTVSYTIGSPELIVDFVEIDSSAMGAIESLYAGRDIVLHSSSYRTYEATIANGTSGQYQLILPSKLMSVKSLTSVHRTSAVQAQAGYTLSTFSNIFYGGNSTWNISLSGRRLPSKPITVRVDGDVSQFFAELEKSNHALGFTDMNGCLTFSGYASNTNLGVGATPNASAFIVGLNLSSIQNSEDSILSGVDLSKETAYLEYNIATDLTDNVLVNSFAYHDILLNISSQTGLMTAVF